MCVSVYVHECVRVCVSLCVFDAASDRDMQQEMIKI